VRILYCALDQQVPGTLGGSVHTRSVAEGLAARGHVVHVLTRMGRGGFPAGPVHWTDLGAPFGRPQLRWMRTPTVARIAAATRPELIMERYQNFGGEGVAAAARQGVPAVLEVNAPMIELPDSRKTQIDRALVLQPMRRWRDWQARHAALLVTPTASILPAGVPPDRVLEIEWGADTTRFTPHAGGPVPYERPSGVVAIFAGAFRAWHGAIQLVDAMKQLRARGVDDISAVLLGDGPERGAVMEAARGVPRVQFTGALPHDAMPAALAAADIGVAPFDVTRHPPLALAFYWSPLKLFEYMATGLPVVAPALDRIQRLVGHGREGCLYDPADPGGLADALAALRDPVLRARMGRAARARAVAEYSWQAHCERLDRALAALVAA
jgi:glycosyltransferase involved in cell wall biosynthesis